MRIIKEETGAIIIDVQEKLMPHMHENKALIANMNILIEGLKTLDIPFVMCEQYRKGLGPTIDEIQSQIAIEAIEKSTFSGCDEPLILEAIKKMQKKFFIVAGIESHVCVLQTVIDLISQGITPVVIENCVSSRKESDKRISIERMRQEGAIITTYESILLAL